MIEFSVLLRLPPAAAFDLFTERVSDWWPPTHRLTKDPASTITMAPGKPFLERATDGRVAELGRVRVWQRPERLELDFYLGTGPDAPTDVVIRFEPEGDGTRITVRHGPLPESAAGWGERVARYRASWPVVLAALSQADGSSEERRPS